MLAARIAQHDLANRYIVHTSRSEPWPDEERITPVRSAQVGAMPTASQKLSGLGYIVRHGAGADVLHIVASVRGRAVESALALRAWSALARRPIVHTIPSPGARTPDPREFPGDVSVVFSEHSKRRLEQQGLSGVVRLAPPLDVERLRPRTAPEVLRRDLELGRRAVLCATHYGDGSGLPELVHAFAHLPAHLGDAVLVLACRHHAGQDPARERERVLAEAARAGVAARVRVLSSVEDMPALILACAVTVLVPRILASKMDLPLIVLESLALGRPAIVSREPPLAEALFGAGGYAVRAGDHAALTDALTRVLEAPDTAHELGRRGRAATLAACDPATAVSRYQGVYALALQARARRRGTAGAERPERRHRRHMRGGA